MCVTSLGSKMCSTPTVRHTLCSMYIKARYISRAQYYKHTVYATHTINTMPTHTAFVAHTVTLTQGAC